MAYLTMHCVHNTTCVEKKNKVIKKNGMEVQGPLLTFAVVLKYLTKA